MRPRWTDVQEMFDTTPDDDKKIVYVEDTPRRFHGYTYFSERPEEMIEWLDAYSGSLACLSPTTS